MAEDKKQWSQRVKPAADMKFLRRVLGVTRLDRIRNEEIRKEYLQDKKVNQEKIADSR